MNRRRLSPWKLAAVCALATALLGAAPSQERHAVVLELEGPIGPASSDFVVRGIERAERDGAELVVLRMNTPGGLDSAMRQIIQKILATTVPVVSFVAPQGSRAASAGTYILYASHVAAMAPATNLGAATPVQIGGMPGAPKPGEPDESPAGGEKPQKNGEESTEGEEASEGDKAPSPGSAMERKLVNDAVAYIRGLALMRGRNAEWAEKAVREAASLTAQDALEENVIELIAADTSELMEKLDGRRVEVLGTEEVLETAGLAVEIVEPDWRSKLLAIITNPNVAYILMMLGVYGLFFELSNPGNVLPGVAGAICLLLALYAFHVLPVNYAGLALILLGIAFITAEAFAPSFGALGIGGAIAFVIGSLILMDTDVEGYEISVPLVVAAAGVSAAFFMTVMTMAMRQRRQPVVSGREEMIGSRGEAMADFDHEGTVFAHGEMWTARTRQPVSKGQAVRVDGVDGLILEISPVAPEEN